jgi:mRNA interferase HicA
VKRVKLEEHLRRHGCHFNHRGGKHDIWINPASGRDAPIPRHIEIKKWAARGICKALGVPPALGD